MFSKNVKKRMMRKIVAKIPGCDFLGTVRVTYSLMKRNFLIPAFALLIFSSVSGADEADNERLKQLDREIAELESEKAKLLENSPEQPPLDPNGLFDAQGQVNQRITDSVVIIEGDKSVGTGFIASTGGKKYVYTAAHVFSGNSRLTARNSSGTSFKKFGDLEAAEGADLVRMEILEDVKNFLEFRPAEPPLQVYKEIAALGNGGGNGVVAVEQGLVLSTSADSVEIDAAIIQGNSGGPVVEIVTGKVIGLATHLTYGQKGVVAAGTPQEKVRRFACRLDREWKWKSMKIGDFLESSNAVDQYIALTEVCSVIVAGLPTFFDGRIISFGSRDPAILRLRDANRDQELMKAYFDMANDLFSKKGSPSVSETKRRFGGLLAMAESQATRSENSLKPETYAWYHRKRAFDAIAARKACLVRLNQESQRFK